ncbi:MAG: CoA-binding protein [Polyangiaceae bacterium]
MNSTRPFLPDDSGLINIFDETKHVAVVGFSDSVSRPSHQIARYLAAHGYRVTGVNPLLAVRGQPAPIIEGILVVPSLLEAREIAPVDLVDVFRRSSEVAPVAEAAIEIGARVLWLQDGVIDLASAERAQQAGLTVVMDTCTLREHRRLVRERVPQR